MVGGWGAVYGCTEKVESGPQPVCARAQGVYVALLTWHVHWWYLLRVLWHVYDNWMQSHRSISWRWRSLLCIQFKVNLSKFLIKGSLEAPWKMEINFWDYAMMHAISVKGGWSLGFMCLCFTAWLQGVRLSSLVELARENPVLWREKLWNFWVVQITEGLVWLAKYFMF